MGRTYGKHKGKSTSMINCSICTQKIVKYKMDLGDTIILEKNEKTFYICDDCAKEIFEQLGDRI